MDTLENILLSIDESRVIDDTITIDKYVAIDLSVKNNILKFNTPIDAAQTTALIQKYLTENNAVVAYGGYSEQRNLYDRSGLFNADEEKRDIHIGIDLWTKAGTPVLAALEGRVHSFALNSGLGNYGPTIILEHYTENQKFYTLYGHLSVESIENIKIGDVFKKGQLLATLGSPEVNGDYSPHLHFQIIKDLQDNFGDYPGVCSKNKLNFYLDNCPNPNLLLKIQTI